MLDVQYGRPADHLRSDFRHSSSLLKCRFCLVDPRLKGLWLVDRKIGQNFPLNLDASAPETVDKSAIGEPVLAGSSINPLNPKRTEVPLLGFAVAIGVLAGFFDGLIGYAESILTATVKTLCLLDHLAVTGMGRDASFYT